MIWRPSPVPSPARRTPDKRGNCVTWTSLSRATGCVTMSLRDAQSLDDRPLPTLVGDAPYECEQLLDWADRRFLLTPGHPELASIHDGEHPSIPQLENLTGARKWWFEHPDWMDFLEEDHAGHEDKLLERSLYMDHWASYIRPGCPGDGSGWRNWTIFTVVFESWL